MADTFMAIGDTSPHLEPPEKIFDEVNETLSKADYRFAQVERVFSRNGTLHEPSMSGHSRYDPKAASAYEEADIDVVGLASNHTMDWGIEGLLDTMECFNDRDIDFIGVGKNLDESREPVFTELSAKKVALLGYCSVLLPQYWATESRPGCAPVRVDSYYQSTEYQPGAPPHVMTKSWDVDLENMKEDIEAASTEADITIVSHHWGVHFKPKHVADYQREIARASVDAGADMIFGHHPHLLLGVEFFDDVPCFYSIGNFAMPKRTGGGPSYAAPRGKFSFGDIYDQELGPGKSYHHKEHFEKSVILQMDVDAEGALTFSLRPVYLTKVNDEGGRQPVPLEPDDSRFDEVVEFIEWSSEDFETEFRRSGDRLMVSNS